MYEYISISGKGNWCCHRPRCSTHDVIDSLFRLGRNASDYSPLTPQQAIAQCSALSGEIEKDLLISLLLQKFRILTLDLFLQLVLPFFI